jgi:hypothetical protein
VSKTGSPGSCKPRGGDPAPVRRVDGPTVALSGAVARVKRPGRRTTRDESPYAGDGTVALWSFRSFWSLMLLRGELG